ncbi:hypothetical protein PPERSA_00540 [Pseudocohnilembus persalinus]|uniref:Uncharacterized protein n=1 Tax=Pseudocohnilembus persalinus TaxID=266149 RepID=A0A0V0QI18_PSEPJ|nr:hypothetical protein PPERSA_00540 [Pseudocohnilembus persalinus]|eukprot:KRX01830.1 hypothetical protein PPERSA_00540 [Pseudocohnilembus persalinus]
MQQNKVCQKVGHNLEYQYINWTDRLEFILQCPKCIIEEQFSNFRKTLISDILSENQKESQVQNWPPLVEKNQTKFINSMFKCSEQNPSEENLFNFKIQQQIDNFFNDFQVNLCLALNKIKKDVKIKFENQINELYQQNRNRGLMNIEEIIHTFKINQLKYILKQFIDNKINIDQFFQFHQSENEVFKHNNLVDQIDNLMTKQMEIDQQFQRLKEEIDNPLSILQKYEFIIKKQINLGFQKSNYKNQSNNFHIAQDNKKIIFNAQSYYNKKQVYSKILEKQKNYHIKIRIDTKGTIKNQGFFFGINTQQIKDQAMNKTNCIYAFIKESYIIGSQHLKREGILNTFTEFFKDNETVLNIIFNINKKQFEIFDDQNLLKVSIELKDVSEPVFYIVNLQYQQVQNELFIDSVVEY